MTVLLIEDKKTLHLSSSTSCGTVCHSNFWLDLNYLEVAKAAQSCSAHFTALLYTEIYVDKIKTTMEESGRYLCVQFFIYFYFSLVYLFFFSEPKASEIENVNQFLFSYDVKSAHLYCIYLF